MLRPSVNPALPTDFDFVEWGKHTDLKRAVDQPFHRYPGKAYGERSAARKGDWFPRYVENRHG